MKTITNLLKIEEWEQEILNNKLIDFYFNANTVIIFDELIDVIDKNDYIEIIEKYKKDMKTSITRLSKFLAVFNDKIVTNNLENKFINNIKKLNDNKLFPLKIGNFTLTLNNNNNLELKDSFNNKFIFKDNFSIKDLENYLLSYYNRKYLNRDKQITSKPFKFIFGEKNMTPFEYLNGIKNLNERITLKKSLQKFIKEELDAYISEIENNKVNLKEYTKLIIGKTRTTIRGILPAAMVLKKNSLAIEIINQFRKVPKEDMNKLINIFKKIKNMKSIEIDPNTSIQRLTQLLENIESNKFNSKNSYDFKIRFLGNYNATGLYFDNTIAIDLRTTFAFVHEFGHHFFETEVTDEIEKPIKSFVSFLRNNMYDVKTKKEYYYKPTEIFARSAEIAYLLDIAGFKPAYNDNKFFTPEKIEKLSKNKHKFTNGIINNFDYYLKNNNIYFNFINMTNEQLSILYSYHSKYLNLEHKTPIKNIEQNYFEIYREKEKRKKGKTLSVKKINRIETMLNFKTFNDEVSVIYHHLHSDYTNYKYNKKNDDIYTMISDSTKERINKAITNIKQLPLFKILSNDKEYSKYIDVEETLDNIEMYYQLVYKNKNEEALEIFNELNKNIKELETYTKEYDKIVDNNKNILSKTEILNKIDILDKNIERIKNLISEYGIYSNIKSINDNMINFLNDNNIFDGKIDKEYYKNHFITKINSYNRDFYKEIKKNKNEYYEHIKNDNKKSENIIKNELDNINPKIYKLRNKINELKTDNDELNKTFNDLIVKNGNFLIKMSNDLHQISKTIDILKTFMKFHPEIQKLFDKNSIKEFIKNSETFIKIKTNTLEFTKHEKSIDIDKIISGEQKISEDNFINYKEIYKYFNVLKSYIQKIPNQKTIDYFIQLSNIAIANNYVSYNIRKVHNYILNSDFNKKKITQIVKDYLVPAYKETKDKIVKEYKNDKIDNSLKEKMVKLVYLDKFETIFNKLEINPDKNKEIKEDKKQKPVQLIFDFDK